MNPKVIFIVANLILIMSCMTEKKNSKGTYGFDLTFLGKYHKNLIELKDSTGKSAIIICPDYQARVMTSTSQGESGFSFGWVNYKLIESGKKQEHIHAFGGEERFWLGPEGGQFSFYFKKGEAFEFKNWEVPKEIDTETFEIVSVSASKASLKKEMHLTNYSGNVFDILVERSINLLDKNEIQKKLGIYLSDKVDYVAYQTENKLTNKGTSAWDTITGMPSIWLLCMFTPSESTVVVAPYNNDKTLKSNVVNDMYFGKVGNDRLQVKDKVILFKADGKKRSKIGLNYERATDIIGSYDYASGNLTILQYNKPATAQKYVNSMWEIQKEPFVGDVVNSYNDGAVDGGEGAGSFYELESSSPAANLQPNQSLIHYQRIYHFQGKQDEIGLITNKLFGINISDIKM